MMATFRRTFACASLAAVAAAGLPATSHSRGAAATVTVANPIALQRPSETIALAVSDIKRVLPFEDPRTIHVRDDPTGQDLLTQVVDLDDDGTFEQLLFQTDMGPRETKRFTLTLGERRVPRASEFKAYGRFVRERRDDFAWENDRIAHRMYGAALETWAQEPLTSSAVDVWTKRTHRLVINDWYMVDDYHRDTGEGADLYSAGKTRGCGGNALWWDGRMYPSANFRGSRVLANGPIRVLFELTYDTWDAGGTAVRETKRISLDAGQQLDRFESTYTGASSALQHAVGIRKAQGADVSVNRQAGVLRTWEAFKEPNGHLGCGVIVDPAAVKDSAEADGNVLLITFLPSSGRVAYYAGFTWDGSDGPPATADWDRYLDAFARRVRAPLEVAVR
jgi:pectinesterase